MKLETIPDAVVAMPPVGGGCCRYLRGAHPNVGTLAQLVLHPPSRWLEAVDYLQGGP